MRLRLVALSLLLLVTPLFAEEYSLGPDSQVHSEVPKGSVTHYVLKPGTFYPGTPHNYSVYVPANYDPDKPAPFIIFLDGNIFLSDGARTPVVLDNLIAKHELPPLIGIFIDPGILPALSDQAQSRYERIFEYDSLSDRYSRFLLTELLPEIEKKYKLSSNPDDRALAGISTGAVGAWMAAWNRPDQFHRVLSFVGTYVAMKGADSLPALVRKTEPKPIRVFMQDGRNDHIVPAEPYGTFFAGSWPINNQVMFQDLQYAGYDAKFVLGDGGHDMRQGAAILPDALRWLWRDYPNPITVHEPTAEEDPGWDPRGKAFSIISATEPWQQINGSHAAVTGLAADKDGNVFFADPAAGHIYKVTPQGVSTVFLKNSEGASSLCIGAEGQLYASEPEHRRIVAYTPDGKRKIVAQGITADAIAISKRGILYFTDEHHHALGLVDTNGHIRSIPIVDDLVRPAAIALSPDQAMLVVTDAQSRFSWSFQIAADGSLINGEPFFRLEMPESGWNSRVSGAKEDLDGRIYFATPLGIQICEANGRVSTILNSPIPEPVTDLIFAGKDRKWLYIVTDNKVFRRPVKVSGIDIENPVKPPRPPL